MPRGARSSAVELTRPHRALLPAGGTSLDHGVLAVGYGASGASQYWLVKNSWGTSWGQAGYLWLGRGPQYGAAGQCGVLLSPSFPTKN